MTTAGGRGRGGGSGAGQAGDGQNLIINNNNNNNNGWPEVTRLVCPACKGPELRGSSQGPFTVVAQSHIHSAASLNNGLSARPSCRLAIAETADRKQAADATHVLGAKSGFGNPDTPAKANKRDGRSLKARWRATP